jgi:hypothetical protein
MAKPPTRRLKVYQAQFGFFDSVVAAPNQTAALKAWGAHQNLFASGDARITKDEAAAKAALEHPGIPLRRPAGSRNPFSLKSEGVPKLPRGAKARARKPAPDRSRLEAAEKALQELDGQREAQEHELRQAQADLDARREAARTSYEASRELARTALADARAAYRKAQGR